MGLVQPWIIHCMMNSWFDLIMKRFHKMTSCCFCFKICNPSLNLLLTLQLQQRQCFQGVGQTFSTTGAPIDTSWSSVSASNTNPRKSARLMQEDWEDPEDLKSDGYRVMQRWSANSLTNMPDLRTTDTAVFDQDMFDIDGRVEWKQDETCGVSFLAFSTTPLFLTASQVDEAVS